ncbi:carbohydrate ABC transporter permease [Halalkalicoccus jeotgali]|uniref:Binding-protein-dependent transport systems inner membrane component n=1 Tax=Halalkalicoccus jeotgali (strain DSM 18796 / CECT 7217 / JCM 14584 / KCTC 4019 / B3) TaxID=795797 RepID=D8JAV1_HALJB|nr:sugar ABC transporter permease [Halalkalicoccus jeotgali]ADJ14823.1 binding-protein-dependent transport systems inner membrane component [Halalkalicoccus jeotgali B3]ELY39406.1 sugar ABC transporter permease [Halalkalicoccus jeotgali B3]
MATDTRNRGRLAPVVDWMENLSEAAYAYLLLLPAFGLLTLIAFYPLISTFWMSLLEDQTRGAETLGGFVGLDNYIGILTGDARLARQFLDIQFTGSFPFFELGVGFFQQALFVTLAFAILNVLFTTLIGFGQALVLDKDFRGRRWVRVAVIIPWAVPIVVQGMIFYLMFQPTVGFGADLMNGLGLFSANPLASSRDSFFIILIADVWKTSAFMALLILAGLQSVDRSLYDVAKVSGASAWQRFKLITFPLVLPALLVAMLFRTMDAMRVYGLIESTAGCTTVPSMTCMVIEGMFGGTRIYGTAAAVAFMTAVIIGVFISVYIVKFRDTDGGVY